MDKHKEFLKKLSELMIEYNAEFSLNYSEGCECCGGDYTLSIETKTDGKYQSTDIYRSYVDGRCVEDHVE